MATNTPNRLQQAAKIVSSIMLSMLVVVAVLTLTLGFLARSGGDGVSRLAGHPILTVLSGSMVPVFHPGDLVFDDPVTASRSTRLVAGDIITFHVAGSATELITHRINAVKLSDSGVLYQTKGDANNAPDSELIAPSQIVGTYRNHVPFGGYFLQAVEKKTVFFFLIFLPLIYLIATSIAKRWNDADSTVSDAAEVDSPSLASREVTAVALTGAASVGEPVGGGGRGLDR